MSSDAATVKVWSARAESKLALRVASELPRDLLARLQTLPEPGRHRRIVQQALRRSVLAEYAGVDPEELELAFAPGRPIISPVDGLVVSASHFDDVTVFAACEAGLASGVDVEPFFEPDWDSAREMVLTQRERQALEKVPLDMQPARYFRLWTLKESVMKALGAGLGDRDPASIEIAFTDRGPALEAIDDADPTETWGLWSSSIDDHIVSLAVRGASTVDAAVFRWPVETTE